MSEKGFWLTNQNGDRMWYAAPERSRCGGSGWMRCYCGGDQCYCGNQGEIDCPGCPDCDGGDGDLVLYSSCTNAPVAPPPETETNAASVTPQSETCNRITGTHYFAVRAGKCQCGMWPCEPPSEAK